VQGRANNNLSLMLLFDGTSLIANTTDVAHNREKDGRGEESQKLRGANVGRAKLQYLRNLYGKQANRNFDEIHKYVNLMNSVREDDENLKDYCTFGKLLPHSLSFCTFKILQPIIVTYQKNPPPIYTKKTDGFFRSCKIYILKPNLMGAVLYCTYVSIIKCTLNRDIINPVFLSVLCAFSFRS
jgi:hypothetical protein